MATLSTVGIVAVGGDGAAYAPSPVAVVRAVDVSNCLIPYGSRVDGV